MKLFNTTNFFSRFKTSINTILTRSYTVRGANRITRPAPVESSTRTYKEQLYSARSFPNPSTTNGSHSLSRLNGMLRTEGILQEVKRRRSFVKPSTLRIRELFKSRQDRFNAMFRQTLTKIMDIHESRK